MTETTPVTQEPTAPKTPATSLLNHPIVLTVSEKTGLAPAWVCVSAVVIGLLSLFMGFGMEFLSDIIGVIYPAYKSFKAIRTKATQDDTSWLTYWVIYGVISLIESIGGGFVSLFHALKIAVLVYCWRESARHHIYGKLIAPLLVKYEASIDETIEQAQQKAVGAGLPVMSRLLSGPGASKPQPQAQHQD